MSARFTALLFLLCPAALLIAADQTVAVKTMVDAKANKRLAASPAPAATYTLTPPYAQTAQGSDLQQHPGCECGLSGTNMPVTPNQVLAKVGLPVNVRYDASRICRKQTIRDPVTQATHPNTDQLGNVVLGSVNWEAGVTSELPMEYGEISYSGYDQAGTQQITVQVKVVCHDDFKNCNQTCVVSKAVPVTVTP